MCYIYTPQMIINGGLHNAGSEFVEAERQISKFRKMANTGPEVTLHRIGWWEGTAKQYTVSLAGKNGDAGCAVFIQMPGGPIQSVQSLAFAK